jgi:GMP synthase (glutamine-hydrolysing)|tara:strand:- start:2914 stop:3453 length:540 start_codon:yes stop_codon:yes gene_type:complete
MILIINICKEKLHYLEFVKPIENILKEKKINFKTKHYKDLNENNIKKFNKIIIAGTSLKDSQFLEDLNKFQWIKSFNKPILGICGGMQILVLIFRGLLRIKKEIGLIDIEFKKEFLGMERKRHAYNLHQFYVMSNEFETLAVSNSKIPQAVKHKTKPFYGTLFHPEVRNKKLIEEFCKL